MTNGKGIVRKGAIAHGTIAHGTLALLPFLSSERVRKKGGQHLSAQKIPLRIAVPPVPVARAWYSDANLAHSLLVSTPHRSVHA